MKKLLATVLLALLPSLALAAAPAVPLMKANVDPSDRASLQRGASLFVNYCAGCHSAEFMRFSRVARDLALPDDLVTQYLTKSGQKIGDTMTSTMPREDAERWFGVAPPDLTLTVRVRGANWLYSYLNGFYRDPSRPVGVNNLVFPDVGMPHVLWELQGMPDPVYSEVGSGNNAELKVTGTRVAEGSGALSPKEYQAATRDLVNFMDYMAEPVKLERQQLGVKVLLFLVVLFVVSYLLKREYWKDVH
jgi:ubiquinol-cytochrome c reductase cytochrome c1 subunit